MNPSIFRSVVILAFAAPPWLLVWFDVPAFGTVFGVAFSFVTVSSTQRSRTHSLPPRPSLPSKTTTTTGFVCDRHRGHEGLYPLHISTNNQCGDDIITDEESIINDGKYSDNTDNNLYQLQKRFEEAMKRRDERLSRMGKSPTLLQESRESLTNDPTCNTLNSIRGDNLVKSSHGDAPGDDASFTSSNRNEYGSNGTIEGESMQIDTDVESFMNDADLMNRSSPSRAKTNHDSRPSMFSDRPSAVSDDRRDHDFDNRHYTDSRYSGTSENYGDRYPGYDDPYDNDEDNYYHEDDVRYATQSGSSSLEWETYRSTSILFPPSLLGERRNNDEWVPPMRPNAIIHFVGGTFFGSYPRKFYGSLLEDISSQCNAVVVATPIPLVLPGRGLVKQVGNWIFEESNNEDVYDRRGENRPERRERGGNDVTANPLDHVSLAKAIQKEFNNAYRDVILDEYCLGYDNEREIEDFMRNVPIVGIGHSLGARIQAVSCSHPHISKRYLSMGKGNRLIRSGREGMIYLGFANWGASSSIPGVATLDQTVRRRKQSRVAEQQDRRGGGVGRREDVWDNRARRKRHSMHGDDMRGRNGRYDKYDAVDLDLADVFGDLLSSIANGAKQIGEAITPQAEDLEFAPTPDELWGALSTTDGWYSRSCRNNLIVQFEDDPIDQGSRLAKTLLKAYNKATPEKNLTSPGTGNFSNEERVDEVKFARLLGGHLTPVTLHGGTVTSIPRGILSILTSSYKFILEQLVDDRMEKTSRRQQKECKDVVDSVATYIQSLISDNR